MADNWRRAFLLLRGSNDRIIEEKEIKYWTIVKMQQCVPIYHVKWHEGNQRKSRKNQSKLKEIQGELRKIQGELRKAYHKYCKKWREENFEEGSSLRPCHMNHKGISRNTLIKEWIVPVREHKLSGVRFFM